MSVLAGPSVMSLTNTVPPSVPALFQSSEPWAGPSLATKKSVPRTLVRLVGDEVPRGWISFTRYAGEPMVKSASLASATAGTRVQLTRARAFEEWGGLTPQA